MSAPVATDKETQLQTAAARFGIGPAPKGRVMFA